MYGLKGDCGGCAESQFGVESSVVVVVVVWGQSGW